MCLVVKILSQIFQQIIVGQPYMNYGFPLANIFRWFHKNKNTTDRQTWNSQTLLWSHYPYMSPPTTVSSHMPVLFHPVCRQWTPLFYGTSTVCYIQRTFKSFLTIPPIISQETYPNVKCVSIDFIIIKGVKSVQSGKGGYDPSLTIVIQKRKIKGKNKYCKNFYKSEGVLNN